MKRNISLWQIMGFALTSLGGTVLHFLYEWSNFSLFTATFSGINESTWEHMKLLFWPMFIYSVFQGFYFKGKNDFWCVKLRGILLGLALIPIIFYTYNGVIGKSPDWLNISIFFVTSAIVYIYETRLFKENTVDCKSKYLSLFILILISLLFVIFTFKTPKINIFKDPLTNTYGI